MTIDNLLNMVKVIRQKIVANLSMFFEKNRNQSICRLLLQIHPNSLTLSRATIFPFLVSFSLIKEGKTAALIFWLVGWLTDVLDGPLAEITERRTKLGKILDPFCDRIFFLIVIMTTIFTDDYIRLLKIILLAALFLELILPILYLYAKIIHRPTRLFHNVYGRIKTILIATTLPMIWFSRHSESWQFTLGFIIGMAVLASIINIKQHLTSLGEKES